MGRWLRVGTISEGFSFFDKYHPNSLIGQFRVVRKISCRGVGSMNDGRGQWFRENFVHAQRRTLIADGRCSANQRIIFHVISDQWFRFKEFL
jgi:hypothetical protein